MPFKDPQSVAAKASKKRRDDRYRSKPGYKDRARLRDQRYNAIIGYLKRRQRNLLKQREVIVTKLEIVQKEIETCLMNMR